MPRVFISHASPDRKAADKLCNLLEDRGIACWIAPRDVRPGHEFGEEIIKGIEECTAIVLILSTNANDSNFVKREVERGVSRRKPVFPLRIREVEPSRSLELFIGSTQWIDAWKPPMEQWLERLVQAIKSLDGTAEAGDRRSSSSRSSSRRRWLVAVVAAVLLAAAGTGLWFLVSGNAIEPYEPPRAQSGSTKTDPPTRAASSPVEPIPKNDNVSTSGETEKKQPWTLEHSLSGHGHSVTSVAFDHDGDQLVSGSLDTTLKLWNVETGECLRTFRPEVKPSGSNDSVASVKVSPDGKLIASAHGWGARVWDLETGEILQRIESQGHRACYAVAFSPDGALLALPDGGVQLWNVNTETTDAVLEDAYVTGMAVAFSPDGSRLATVGDGSVKLWDLESGECRRTIKPESRATPQFTSLAFSSDGSQIAAACSAGSGGALYLWEVATGKSVHALAGAGAKVHSVAFSPTDFYLASGGWDRIVTIWDTETGKVVHNLGGDGGYIESLAFSPDGGMIAVGFADQVIKVWATR